MRSFPVKEGLVASLVDHSFSRWDPLANRCLPQLHALAEVNRRFRLQMEIRAYASASDLSDSGIAIIKDPSSLVADAHFLASDVIIFNFGGHDDLFDAIHLAPRNARVVVYYHGITPPSHLPDEERARAYASLRQAVNLHAADKIITLNDFLCRELKGYGIPAEKITVLPLPLMLDKAPTCQGREVARDRLHLLHGGSSLLSADGLMDLLRSIEIISRRNMRVDVRLLCPRSRATHESFNSLQQYIEKHGLDQSVRFQFGVPADSLAAQFRHSDALVLTCHYAGSGGLAAEALNHGCFVIGSDAGTLPDTLRGLGRIFAAGDVDELTNRLEELAEARRRDGFMTDRGFFRSGEWADLAARRAAKFSPARFHERYWDSVFAGLQPVHRLIQRSFSETRGGILAGIEIDGVKQREIPAPRRRIEEALRHGPGVDGDLEQILQTRVPGDSTAGHPAAGSSPSSRRDAPVGRLFIECTYTYNFGGNTGIQRTVRNIAGHCRDLGKALGVRCEPVVLSGTGFRVIDGALPLAPRLEIEFMQYLQERAMSLKILLRSMVPRRLRGPVGRLFGRPFFGVFWRLLGRCRTWTRAIVAILFGFGGRAVRWQPGDALLLADSAWFSSDAMLKSVARARKTGVRVGAVIYDLIPINHAHTCDRYLALCFRKWLCGLVPLCDVFVCISQATKKELLSFIAGRSDLVPPLEAVFEVFPLGANLDLEHTRTSARPEIVEHFKRLSERRIYLAVGTVEPRKNHPALLDTFEELWRRNVDVTLVIVGKRGWLSEHTMNRIEFHREMGRRLFIHNDLTDAELAVVYESASVLVSPSLAEGFNLPVVEALNRGLAVFASDIPIHREVGGAFCTYFSLGQPHALATLIERFERTGRVPGTIRPAAEFSWPDWKESTRDLIRKTLDAMDGRRNRTPGPRSALENRTVPLRRNSALLSGGRIRSEISFEKQPWRRRRH